MTEQFYPVGLVRKPVAGQVEEDHPEVGGEEGQGTVVVEGGAGVSVDEDDGLGAAPLHQGEHAQVLVLEVSGIQQTMVWRKGTFLCF